MTTRALSSSSVTLTTGSLWSMVAEVRDDDGYHANDALVVTITLPGGATITPIVETITTGVHRVLYPVMNPGRHTAVASSVGYGSVAFAAWVEQVVTAAGFPDLAAVRAYDPLDSWTDDEVQEALDAEAGAQRSICRIGAIYPADLRQALLRRVPRNLAMRRLPLAVLTGDAEAGPDILPGNDPEVRRLEKPFRKRRVG